MESYLTALLAVAILVMFPGLNQAKAAQETFPIRLETSMSNFWKFHKATPQEQTQYADVIPSLPGYEPIEAVEEVSQSIVLFSQAPGTNLVRVLRYSAESKEDSDYDMNIYQVLVTDKDGKVLQKDLIKHDSNFMIGHDGQWGPYISSFTFGKNGEAGYYKIDLMKGELNGSWFESISGWKMVDVKDSLPMFRQPYETILLGKPENGGPYGLYLHTSSHRPQLIKEFSKVVPGYGDNKPLQITNKFLGAYQNERGYFVLLNDLKGIVSVNIDTGEFKALYEVPDSNRFSYVLSENKALNGKNCTEIVVGVYDKKSAMNMYFPAAHDYYPGPEDFYPAYTLHLGIFADNKFFRLSPTGCNFQ